MPFYLYQVNDPSSDNGSAEVIVTAPNREGVMREVRKHLESLNRQDLIQGGSCRRIKFDSPVLYSTVETR